MDDNPIKYDGMREFYTSARRACEIDMLEDIAALEAIELREDDIDAAVASGMPNPENIAPGFRKRVYNPYSTMKGLREAKLKEQNSGDK